MLAEAESASRPTSRIPYNPPNVCGEGCWRAIWCASRNAGRLGGEGLGSAEPERSRRDLVRMVATASHWPVVAVRAARLGLVSRPASQREQAHCGGEGGGGVQRPAIAGVGVLLNVVVPKVRVGHGARAGIGSRYSTAARGDRPLRHNQDCRVGTGRWHCSGAILTVTVVVAAIASRPKYVVELDLTRFYGHVFLLEALDVCSRCVPLRC